MGSREINRMIWQISQVWYANSSSWQLLWNCLLGSLGKMQLLTLFILRLWFVSLFYLSLSFMIYIIVIHVYSCIFMYLCIYICIYLYSIPVWHENRHHSLNLTVRWIQDISPLTKPHTGQDVNHPRSFWHLDIGLAVGWTVCLMW